MKKFLPILAVLLLCGAALAPLSVRIAKTVRAEQHLQSAREAFEANNYDEAFKRLSSAANLEPGNREIQSLMGPFAAKIHHSRALYWWLEAASEDLLNSESLKDMIVFAHENGHFTEVGPYLQEALEENPKDELLRTRQLTYLQYQRKDLEAFHLARTLLQEGVQNPVVRSSYLFLRFSLPQISREYESESVEFLREFARDEGKDGLIALRILLDSWPLLDVSTRDFVSGQLARHPESDLLDQLNLLARQRLIGLSPATVLESADELFAKYGGSGTKIVREAADVHSSAEAIYASWLTQQGFHEACVRFVNGLKTELDQELSIARIVALVNLGEFDQASQLILGTQLLTQLQKLYLRVLSLEAQGQLDERDELLALMVTVVDSSQVDWLEPILLARNRRDLVIEVYQKLEQTLETPFPARMKLLEYYYREGIGSELAHLTAKLDPSDLSRLPVQRSLLLYLKLILNRNVDGTRREMEMLVADFPNIVDYRILLALSYALSGETEGAADLLNSFEAGLIPNRQSLLVGAAYVYQLNADLTRARDVFARIDADQLLPVERTLLHKLL